MPQPFPADRFRGTAARESAGALVSLGIAVVLFTRVGLDANLRRDEAIYAYAGQQLTHGVAPYASIFDPKTPLASLLAGLAAALAHLVGVDDLPAMRAVYFGTACLTVVAMYYLALRLWRSPVAGLVAAAVFASFRGFAIDALGGPNAKTPGIMLAVVSLLLVVQRRWFWAAFTGALAFLVWQPLIVYAAVAVVLAPANAGPGQRRKAFGLAVGGAAVPVVVTALYFAIAGALGKLVEASFVFPATGIQRGKETLAARLRHIADVVHSGYGHSGLLFWLGLVLLLVVIAVHLLRGRADLGTSLRRPLVCAVLPTLLVVIAFSASDFQGYPDLYPLLPYAALGLGGAAAVVLSLLAQPALRQAAVAVAMVCVLVLTVLSFRWLGADPAANRKLVAQRAAACDLDLMVRRGRPLYALGDPTSLVLTHRRNPSRFVYLNSGVAQWDIKHTKGGYPGWKAKILATRPDVIVVHAWFSPTAVTTVRWLETRYDSAFVGTWRVFLAPGVRARAQSRGVQLGSHPGRAVAPAGARAAGRC